MHESHPELLSQSPTLSFSSWRDHLLFWVLAWAAAVSPGCQSQSGPSTSSSSHWLTCLVDDDCSNLEVEASCSSSGETSGYCVNESGAALSLLPTFEAQFSGTTVSSTDFRFETGTALRNNELQTFTESSDNVFVEDGELVIVARVSSDGNEYTSGSLELIHPVTFGRIEASIKTDVGSGSKPSFGMLPVDPSPTINTCVDGGNCSDGTWPAWGAIVILSGRADGRALQALNYSTDQAGVINLRENVQATEMNTSISAEYHLYALEWGPQRIDWFIDDQLVHSVDLNSADIYHPGGVHPFHQPFRIYLNLSVGGLVEAPVPADYPREMRVRSLRILKVQ